MQGGYHCNMNAKKTLDKGRKKMMYYVKFQIAEKSFGPDILRLRPKYKIPINGYDEKTIKVWEPSFTSLTSLPKEWFYFGNIQKLRDLLSEIRKIKNKFLLERDFWDIFLLEYTFFNTFDSSTGSENLCVLTTPKSESEFFSYLQSIKNEDYLKMHEKKMDEWFPISIRVSPYASINDIKSFITTNSESIERAQNDYKKFGVKIGKVRGRNTYARDKFILEHKHLHRAEISKLLLEKLGHKVDAITIRSIISKSLHKRGKK